MIKRRQRCPSHYQICFSLDYFFFSLISKIFHSNFIFHPNCASLQQSGQEDYLLLCSSISVASCKMKTNKTKNKQKTTEQPV